jgi:hypothetical protein
VGQLGQGPFVQMKQKCTACNEDRMLARCPVAAFLKHRSPIVRLQPLPHTTSSRSINLSCLGLNHQVMSNPELAAGFQNPKVQAAIIDISSNPMNIVKYQQDPEVRCIVQLSPFCMLHFEPCTCKIKPGLTTGQQTLGITCKPCHHHVLPELPCSPACRS